MAEGSVLAEFSGLNSYAANFSQDVAAGAASSRERGSLGNDKRRSLGLVGSGAVGATSSSASAEAQYHERLLRGEATYTGGLDASTGEHFVDDQPLGAPLGVGALLGGSVATTEERERLLRRLEMCAKARDESTKIMSARFAQRDAVKSEMRKERYVHQERLQSAQRERDERWSRKLQRSPFAVDLVAENQRIDEENRVKDHIEQRRQRLLALRSREAHNDIFRRATAEADELHALRIEKRQLLQNARQLKAMRDVERSNARTAQILQERRQMQAQKQVQLRFAGTQAMNTPRSGQWPMTARSA